MLLQVQFKDFNYRYVDTHSLDRFFASKTLQPLLRPSEERSTNAYHKPVRDLSSQTYYNQQGKLIKNTSIAQSTFEIYI